MPTKLYVLLLINSLIILAICKTNEPSDKCLNQVYQQCTQQTHFTTQEILTAQLFMQTVFAETNPSQPLCAISLTKPPCIRKDVKCLTDDELNKLTNAWKQLNINGIVANFTKTHNDYWGAAHKFTVGPVWHWELARQLELELQKVDPDICLPYWNAVKDFAYPEKSVIFKIFGGGGDPSNEYCLMDGPFANMTCSFPEPHCLRRQFKEDNTLYPWKSPEYNTMVMQMGSSLELTLTFIIMTVKQLTLQMITSIDNFLKYLPYYLDPTHASYVQRVTLLALTSHFDTHLSIGGWAGDMSVPWAPNDLLFYLFHTYYEIEDIKIQLSNSVDRMPLTWNSAPIYDNVTGYRYWGDIDNDRFPGMTKKVKEFFQYGYGDQCYLYDQLIGPINDVVKRNQIFQTKNKGINLENIKCIPDEEIPEDITTDSDYITDITDNTDTDLTLATEIPELPTIPPIITTLLPILSTLLTLPSINASLVPTLPTLPIHPITTPSLPSLPTLPTLPQLPKLFLPPCNSGPLPVAAQRLKDALPPILFAKYFPKFANNKWTIFDHVFEDIDSDCNPVSKTCRKMPLALPFSATPEGQRQYQAFTASVADYDITDSVNTGQKIYAEFMEILNYLDYCSPYV